MDELMFVVEEKPGGGLIARAVGKDITVEARDREDLREKIQDAIEQHFEEDTAPARVRLHWRATGAT
ncbi:MAG: 2-oxoisovalerate dehydrogenase [Chloroflexi bacterium]|nr:2-oxoisovalerate dehydrogenase [Chloroflexota bacterium]